MLLQRLATGATGVKQRDRQLPTDYSLGTRIRRRSIQVYVSSVMSTILHILLLALAFFRPIVTMLDLSSSIA